MRKLREVKSLSHCHKAHRSQSWDLNMGQAHAISIFLATNSILGLTHRGGSQQWLVDERMSLRLLGGKVDAARRADQLGF